MKVYFYEIIAQIKNICITQRNIFDKMFEKNIHTKHKHERVHRVGKVGRFTIYVGKSV